MAGVDVDESMVSFCNDSFIPGGYFSIAAGGGLPFADAAFRLVTAYSVFTHSAGAAIQGVGYLNLLRVTAPGGIDRFYCGAGTLPRFHGDGRSLLSPLRPGTWRCKAKLGDLEARRRELHVDGLTYIPTGGGAYRPPENYGETVVTPKFVQSCVADRWGDAGLLRPARSVLAGCSGGAPPPLAPAGATDAALALKPAWTTMYSRQRPTIASAR